MSKEDAKGRFCWFDLSTTDVEAAKAFYTALIGWEIEKFEGGGDMDYAMWKGPKGTIGGVMVLPEEAKKMGAPPHWVGYVATADIKATGAEAEKLGATVLVPPTEIPTVGQFSVLQDPQGAVFSTFEPAEDTPGDDDKPGVGQVSWHELGTSDYEKAWDFYSTLFGWKKTDSMDMGKEMGGTYQMFGRKDQTLGGMFNKPAEMPGPPAWLYYISVEDMNAAVAKAKELGAQVLNGPMEVPGGDMVAQLMDPQGAAFALHSAKKDG